MKHHPDAGQRQILAAIEAERALLMDAARPEAMKRLAERGRLSARKRIELHKKAERWRQILDQAGVGNTAELIKQEIEERLRDDD